MGVIENMKEVADLVKKIGDIELNRKIVSLEEEVHELKREKIRVETKLNEAEALLSKREELEFREPFYYLDGDDVPRCPACWKAKDIEMPLVFMASRQSETHWRCPNCKHDYYDKKDKSERPAPTAGRRMPFRSGRNNWMAR
jgi:uncharacterized C2H2 Zn-finger protein